MLRAARFTGLTTVLASLCFLAGAGVEAGAPSDAVDVTTDTLTYCHHLSDEVSARVKSAAIAPPPEVAVLAGEGDRLCDEGQVRGGIQRLRRAWLLVTHPERIGVQQ
ncbi:hypothetical protein [Rhodopila sp.]|jgi:hypothetical protein|uniref:hypothetical protein n=1 Tax=Rhodopila sp. TaxID=2480087 RepID=UPI002D11E5FD|nr:hypothetical protein [Rhodopila sp.]HVZ08810.1 hypothetical protein [Rhodopila sp.]